MLAFLDDVLKLELQRAAYPGAENKNILTGLTRSTETLLTFMPRYYVTYARNDDASTADGREMIVDQLCKAAEARGIENYATKTFSMLATAYRNSCMQSGRRSPHFRGPAEVWVRRALPW